MNRRTLNWLTVARVGWAGLALLILALSALALPRAVALLESVCQSGARCLDVQLTPYDLRLLQQLGLSLNFLVVYDLTWVVVTLLVNFALATLLFWRRSSDPMALFCAYMLVLWGGATYTSLFDLGLRTQGPAWYWLVGSLEVVAQVSFYTFFVLFPSGRFVPRCTVWMVAVTAILEAHYVLITDPLQAARSGPFDFLGFAGLTLGLVALQIYRYRRVSTFQERQQTKWVVFGLSLAVVGFVSTFLAAQILLPEEFVQSAVFQILGSSSLGYVALLFIPISIAVAVLRSRLYDIDLVINRTLVYGALTVSLALVYWGGVALFQALLRPVTGGENDLAIVATTLLIAALFLPLHSAIQRFIDRRFYRRKYDAARTLAAFGQVARDEVDLDRLAGKLVGVVEETMQPAHVSIWLGSRHKETM